MKKYISFLGSSLLITSVELFGDHLASLNGLIFLSVTILLIEFIAFFCLF